VRSREGAAEKLEWYAQRWKIETFQKILKSGCGAEEAKLRTAERLANLIAILCIVSWRIFWITMLNRTDPEASPNDAFTQLDQYLLDELLPLRLPRLQSHLSRTTSSNSLALEAILPAPTIRHPATP
jgi:hypothetical protein